MNEIRAELINDLKNYQPVNEREDGFRLRIIELVETQERCFYRDCMPGHMTGAGLLINKAGDKVLMNHHKVIDKWLCFGGHADGDEDICNVARRETFEESGIEDIALAFDGILDVDVHPIPANEKRGENDHEHFDVRYLFRVTGDKDFVISDESLALRWCTYEEAQGLVSCFGMNRMLDKWQSWKIKSKAKAA